MEATGDGVVSGDGGVGRWWRPEMVASGDGGVGWSRMVASGDGVDIGGRSESIQER